MFIKKSEAKNRTYYELKRGLRHTDPDSDSSGPPLIGIAEGEPGPGEDPSTRNAFPELIVSISGDPAIRIRNGHVASLNREIAKLHSLKQDVGEVKSYVRGDVSSHESESTSFHQEQLVSKIGRVGKELGVSLGSTPGIGDIHQVKLEESASATQKFSTFFDQTERLIRLAQDDLHSIVQSMVADHSPSAEQEVLAEMTSANAAANDLRTDIVTSGEQALFGVANQDPLKVFELLSQ